MERNSIAIHHARAKGEVIDYWLTIDKIDSELSGLPLKYRSSEEVSAALGVGRKMVDEILYRVRKQHLRPRVLA